MGLDPVSLKIDQQLLQFMEQLEILEEKRQKLNSLIEEGWFNISKARYSMGNKQISALQYASEMKPLICVQSSISEKGEVAFKCEPTEFKSEELKASGTAEDIGPKDGVGLRRRMKIKQKESTEEDTSKVQHEQEPQHSLKSEKSPCQHQDPLKWFGILVPQNLKQAQAAFKEVIMLSAEIATLQNVISATRMEMQTQMKDKHKSCLELRE